MLLQPGGAAVGAPINPERGRLLKGVKEEKTDHIDTSDLSEKEVDGSAAV